MGRDAATAFVLIAVGSVLAVMVYVALVHPRERDPERPNELSGLRPPFPSPTGGVRKC